MGGWVETFAYYSPYPRFDPQNCSLPNKQTNNNNKKNPKPIETIVSKANTLQINCLRLIMVLVKTLFFGLIFGNPYCTSCGHRKFTHTPFNNNQKLHRFPCDFIYIQT